MKNEEETNLKEYLQEFRSQGVELYLGKEPASPEEIAQRVCVRENAVYMPDFVLDDEGRLTKVRYDLIRHC